MTPPQEKIEMSNNFKNCQNLKFEVGKRYSFIYNGKMRQVTVYDVTKNSIFGIDHFVLYPVGGYRRFKIDKIEMIK